MMQSKTGVIPPDGEALLGENLADDLLRGADRIAEFLFGDPAERRKVYHLSEKSRVPVFRLGSVLCARKSTLKAWIEEQERRAVAGV
jgi:hypothetical protein